MAYPQLEYLGNLSVTLGVEHVVLGAKFGDGYRASALVGSPGGTRTWQLNYSALHTRPFGAHASNWASESRADYIWNFYLDRMRAGNEPFALVCPRTGKTYLAVFSEPKLSFEMVDRFLCTSGLQLEQCRVTDVTTSEDGSIG